MRKGIRGRREGIHREEGRVHTINIKGTIKPKGRHMLEEDIVVNYVIHVLRKERLGWLRPLQP
eukprot:8432987-Prorocentrum_lima.AAC.1